MPRLAAICVFGSFLYVFHSLAQEPSKERVIELAEAIVKSINAGDVDEFRKDFDDAMLKALPPDKCKAFFANVKSTFGTIGKLEPPTLKAPGTAVFVARCEKIPADLTVSVNDKGKVGGLQMLPHSEIPVPVRNETAMALPLTGGKWFVVWGGDTAASNGGHFKDRAQKYAIDLVGAGEDGKSFKGNGKRNEDYHCFGRNILAPADGVVIEVIDGVHDNKPGVMNPYCALGNAVLIQHAKHEISLLAHFKQHSIQVKPNDKVKRGQLLGQCGNSGNSSEPHLHFHLQNTPRIEDASGVKCFFEQVDVEKDRKTAAQMNYLLGKGDVVVGKSN